MKKTLILIASLCLLSNCATTSINNNLEGVCRHKALYCASIYREHYSTKIRVWSVPKEIDLHAQTIIYKDNKWQYLIFNKGVCEIGEREFPVLNKDYEYDIDISTFVKAYIVELFPER